jgi:hypothetical protein
MSILIQNFPPFRGGRFCLSLQEDSVFADFDVDSDGRVFLLRISFDGYGCCSGDFTKLNPEDSGLLLDAVGRNAVARPEIQILLRAYFAANKGLIWSDALESHGLR